VHLTRAPQFFTLATLLEQVRTAGQHFLRFHDSATWAAGVLALKSGQHDAQTTHNRDALYLVLRGEAALSIGGDRHPVAPGDFWLVPAGLTHRFEEFRGELVVFSVLVDT